MSTEQSSAAFRTSRPSTRTLDKPSAPITGPGFRARVSEAIQSSGRSPSQSGGEAAPFSSSRQRPPG